MSDPLAWQGSRWRAGLIPPHYLYQRRELTKKGFTLVLKEALHLTLEGIKLLPAEIVTLPRPRQCYQYMRDKIFFWRDR